MNKSMKRNRPYVGQSHTDQGVRGKTEVKGLTFRDISDCLVRAFCLSNGVDNRKAYAEADKGENAKLNWNDIYDLKGESSPMALGQNLSCEIEKMMGIFPNVPELEGSPIDSVEMIDQEQIKNL